MWILRSNRHYIVAILGILQSLYCFLALVYLHLLRLGRLNFVCFLLALRRNRIYVPSNCPFCLGFQPNVRRILIRFLCVLAIDHASFRRLHFFLRTNGSNEYTYWLCFIAILHSKVHLFSFYLHVGLKKLTPWAVLSRLELEYHLVRQVGR